MSNPDVKLIDDLIVLFHVKTGLSFEQLETEYHTTERAMKRLREAFEGGGQEMTAALCMHFRRTASADL